MPKNWRQIGFVCDQLRNSFAAAIEKAYYQNYKEQGQQHSSVPISINHAVPIRELLAEHVVESDLSWCLDMINQAVGELGQTLRSNGQPDFFANIAEVEERTGNVWVVATNNATLLMKNFDTLTDMARKAGKENAEKPAKQRPWPP